MNNLAKSRFNLHIASIFNHYFIFTSIIAILALASTIIMPLVATTASLFIMLILVFYGIFTLCTMFVFLAVPEYRQFPGKLLDMLGDSGEFIVKTNNTIESYSPYLYTLIGVLLALSILFTVLSRDKVSIKAKIKSSIIFGIIISICGVITITGGASSWLN